MKKSDLRIDPETLDRLEGATRKAKKAIEQMGRSMATVPLTFNRAIRRAWRRSRGAAFYVPVETPEQARRRNAKKVRRDRHDGRNA